MAEFNMYNLYSYNAGDFKNACNDKILVDLHRLESITEYYDVLDFVDKTFGIIEDQKIMDYPNNVKVIVQKKENQIMVGALKGEEQIFGQAWIFTPNKED
ncbi:hypothetical protein IJ750_06200 [bacterium]|nr:hypothetical protein [bacterium]MBR1776642.1 hypothetical protein [bacterium]